MSVKYQFKAPARARLPSGSLLLLRLVKRENPSITLLSRALASIARGPINVQVQASFVNTVMQNTRTDSVDLDLVFHSIWEYIPIREVIVPAHGAAPVACMDME